MIILRNVFCQRDLNPPSPLLTKKTIVHFKEKWLHCKGRSKYVLNILYNCKVKFYKFPLNFKIHTN